MSEQEEQHKQNLQTAQQSSKNWGVSDTAKNITEAANPIGAISLLSQANIFSDMPFVVAFGAALLKDVLDFGMIASLPGLSAVFSFMCGILIFFMILLTGNNSKRKSAKGMVGVKGAPGMLKPFLALIFGTMIEAFGFGLNFFPFEFFTVFVIYFMILSDRKKATMQDFEG